MGVKPTPVWQLLGPSSHPSPERPYAVIRHDPTASRLLGQWRWEVHLGGWGAWRPDRRGQVSRGLCGGRARDEATARSSAQIALAKVVEVRERMVAERAAAPRSVSLWVQP